jgi:ATP-dependent exoDNAse (exonuclease V) beta subunit
MKNEAILASAGSGKTYQLTNRYLAILGQAHLAGEEPRPDQIVAVTFTRKAAGEFFEEILQKLALGASGEQGAKAIAGQPDDAENPFYDILSQLKPDDYQILLASFIKRMPGLFLGTLDSFFSQIVRSFPAEFGLTGDFEIIDDHAASRARAEVFQRVFQEAAQSDGAEEFLEAFRLANFGKEESSVQYVLDQFIENHHHILLAAGSKELWGNARTIWPGGSDWFGASGDHATDLAALFDYLREETLTEKQWLFLEEFEADLMAYEPGAKHGNRLKDLFGKFLANWEDLQNGEATFPVGGKKLTFGAKECALLSNITRRLVSDELKTKLLHTHGLWQVLHQYEQIYSRLVRRRGRLTFHDLEVILAGSDATGMTRPTLSQSPDADTRMRIDYRLDATFHHWMLDEFQDTSYLQWSVIKNLIDETIQDDSGERSFFQVGDIKQAIYAWRGGDTRLFDDIARRYSDLGPRSLETRNLDVSWRSGSDIIEPLNLIFGNREAIANLGFPQEAPDRWRWQTHRVAAPNQERAGFTAYYQPSSEDPAKEHIHELTLALLKEIQPLEQGLSCVLLVQNNAEVRALVDYVRSHSRIAIASEADVAIAVDNPVTQAFLSLFRVAAHPHDSFHQRHLEMSPLAALFGEEGLVAARLSKTIRRQVHEHGCEETLLDWIEKSDAAEIAIDSFSRQRLHELGNVARLFDAGNSSSLDEFLAFAESYKLREPNARTAVQVMTIHKSKGLTFDVAILPQLDGSSLTNARNDIAVQRDEETREVEWVLDLPRKAIAQADPVLQDYHSHLEAEAGYEQLCKFYVALTRARYANYLISLPRKKTSSSRNFIQLLDETLDNDNEGEERELHGIPYRVAYESDLPTTRADWWRALPAKEITPPPPAPKPLPALAPRVRPARRTPSKDKDPQRAAQLFAHDTAARDFGNAVHALFQSIPWWTREIELLERSGHEPAQQEVQRVLANTACQQLLAKPDLSGGQTAKLWREQNFEVLLDGYWVSGIIDRAHLIFDGAGKALSAEIIDFKTDAVSDETAAQKRAQSYREQMSNYRRAVAFLLDLPEEKVTSKLLFTRLPLVVELS